MDQHRQWAYQLYFLLGLLKSIFHREFLEHYTDEANGSNWVIVHPEFKNHNLVIATNSIDKLLRNIDFLMSNSSLVAPVLYESWFSR